MVSSVGLFTARLDIQLIDSHAVLHQHDYWIAVSSRDPCQPLCHSGLAAVSYEFDPFRWYFLRSHHGGYVFEPKRGKRCIDPVGDLADYFGRRITIIAGCLVFCVGAILQTASTGLGLMVAGRLVAGFGVGFVSAVIILYLSEIAPRKVRGAIVSGYQFCITIGILFANCVVYSTQNRLDTGSYRIPVAVQFLWALILGVGLFLLPESPRWYVKKGRVDAAAVALGRVRGQPSDSDYVQNELAEIIANHEYETALIPSATYFASWGACFSGSITNPGSNLRRTVTGISLQMMQQFTGKSLSVPFPASSCHLQPYKRARR